jgi:hypothetical protein
MASAALHRLFDIQQPSSTSTVTPPVASPPATHQKNTSIVNEAPSNIELDNLAFGQRYNGPSTAQQASKGIVGTQTPKTPNELEMSRPGSPTGNEAVPLMQTWNNPPMNKWRILCCCLIYFGNGMNDSGRFPSRSLI